MSQTHCIYGLDRLPNIQSWLQPQTKMPSSYLANHGDRCSSSSKWWMWGWNFDCCNFISRHYPLTASYIGRWSHGNTWISTIQSAIGHGDRQRTEVRASQSMSISDSMAANDRLVVNARWVPRLLYCTTRFSTLLMRASLMTSWLPLHNTRRLITRAIVIPSRKSPASFSKLRHTVLMQQQRRILT